MKKCENQNETKTKSAKKHKSFFGAERAATKVQGMKTLFDDKIGNLQMRVQVGGVAAGVEFNYLGISEIYLSVSGNWDFAFDRNDLVVRSFQMFTSITHFRPS